jgi:arsenate reductase
MAKRRVLFLCTGNSARSQMAEGFLRHLAPNDVDVCSAGTEPREAVHPRAVQVMAEEGIDVSEQRPKSLRPFVGEPGDLIITVCDRARESCPVFPSRHEQIHRSFRDPADPPWSEEQCLPVFRIVGDEIATRIRLFVSARTRQDRQEPARKSLPRSKRRYQAR